MDSTPYNTDDELESDYKKYGKSAHWFAKYLQPSLPN